MTEGGSDEGALIDGQPLMPPPAQRDDVREFGYAILAFVVVLLLVTALIQAHPLAPWRVIVALIPLAPAAFGLMAIVRFLARLDERQRRIQVEALAFGFGGSAILTFTYGFLQNVGFPSVSWIWVWPLMAVLWLVGLGLASRR